MTLDFQGSSSWFALAVREATTFFFPLPSTSTARRTKKSRSPASSNREQMVMNLIEDWSRVLGAPNGTVGRQMVQGGGSLRRKVRVVVNEVPRQSGCRQVSTSAGGDNTARPSCRPDPQDALFSNARDCFGRMTRGNALSNEMPLWLP